jgi:glucose/arabinose dehydrogenase
MPAIAFRAAVAACLLAVVCAPASAQRRGFPTPPLPPGPIEYETGAGIDIRVTILARDLERPWSLAFLPDDSILITERIGRLRLFRDGELLPDPIAGVPDVEVGFLGGLFDVKLHPDFARNRYVYLTYDKPRGEDDSAMAVARGVFDGRALNDVEDIFIAEGVDSVSRMLFAPDGKLYVSAYGANGEQSQEPDMLGGKILRLNDDGTVPDDNPFAGRPGYRPEIYTMGHRSPESLLWHEPTGTIWEVEMGPNGGDEVNILVAGGNYGWPLVSLGRTYPGPWQSDKFYLEGMTDPVVFWVPSISTAGATFYTGERLGAWKGNLFVGGVRYGEIAGTGQLSRVVFNEDMQEIRRESLLTDLRRRIREVKQGPDELLYILTDEDDGALLRIEPAE